MLRLSGAPVLRRPYAQATYDIVIQIPDCKSCHYELRAVKRCNDSITIANHFVKIASSK